MVTILTQHLLVHFQLKKAEKIKCKISNNKISWLSQRQNGKICLIQGQYKKFKLEGMRTGSLFSVPQSKANKNPHPTLHAAMFSELPEPIKIDRLCLSIKIFYQMDANTIIKVEWWLNHVLKLTTKFKLEV